MKFPGAFLCPQLNSSKTRKNRWHDKSDEGAANLAGGNSLINLIKQASLKWYNVGN